MLPKTADYALRATVWLAQEPGGRASADRLASATRVPRRYLHRVLQNLVRAGLVQSHPGPGGGYGLARHPREITILDVVNAVAPIERIPHCPLGLTTHDKLCPLHRELDQVYATIEKSLSRVTMEHLLRSAKDCVPLCQNCESQDQNGRAHDEEPLPGKVKRARTRSC
ncbi:MAG: Rrf2 family transcriptional regulator [Pirellulales bacterium]|nr:Rrf2 family transcriptional regulator [Pirellulales bacterium]